MPASIGDVAEHAGVSVATVSRALRGLPNVAPSTRARVLEAAARLGYVADARAAGLASGRTRTIGVAVPLIGPWFFSQVLAGVEAVVTDRDLDLLVLTVDDDAGRQRLASGARLRGRVDGVIAVDVALTEEQRATLAANDLPAVLVGLRGEDLPCVLVDNVEVGRTATEHLLSLGHTRIGLVGHARDDPLRFSVPEERRRGYHEALAAAGIDPDPRLELDGNFSIPGGAEAAEALLALPEPPTAILAMSDEMAFGCLRLARQRGLAVPGDLSVVGVDDHDVAAAWDLTTVSQPVQGMGEQAAELLLAVIDAGATAPAHLTVPSRLRVRGTTGPAKADRTPSRSTQDAIT